MTVATTFAPEEEECEFENSILKDIIGIDMFDCESNAKCTMKTGHIDRDYPATCWVWHEGKDAPTDIACNFCKDVVVTAARLRPTERVAAPKPGWTGPTGSDRHVPETPLPSLPSSYVMSGASHPTGFCEISSTDRAALARAVAIVTYENNRSRRACAACLRAAKQCLDFIESRNGGISGAATGVVPKWQDLVVANPWTRTNGAVTGYVAEQCLDGKESQEGGTSSEAVLDLPLISAENIARYWRR
ncbi:hypothetical protein F5X99DRAFT_432318 [Biscogniauxia marginata]|nr:hypothetical protein F5X99DRAFT_432318 [Biscogniauxia marginata]